MGESLAEPLRSAGPAEEPLRSAGPAEEPLRSAWHPNRPVDPRRTMAPVRRGSGDPACQFDADGTIWWASRTPLGIGTLALRMAGDGVQATAWGPGAPWLLDRVPTLLGVEDDWTQLDLSGFPGLRDVRHRHPGLRLPATGRVLEALVPAALEQRVTGGEARRSWRGLLQRFGTPAPGPRPHQPDAAGLLAVSPWDWYQLGVDAARQRPIRAAATAALGLEAWAESTVLARLQSLPGVGPWTAAETVQRAFGHPDAVSVGDYHRPDLVVYALTGRARGDDAEMLSLLQRWAGQRQRVVRLIELSGVRPPRFGPRYAPLDLRAM